MSIYGTWLHLSDDNHEDGCAVYVEDPPGSGCFEFSGNSCDCGIPRAPIVYEGSHILPAADARRAGALEVGAIPDHITRDGRDDAPEGALKDWLRIGIHSVDSEEQYQGRPYRRAGDATVVLDRRLVEELRDTLTNWLDREVTD